MGRNILRGDYRSLRESESQKSQLMIAGECPSESTPSTSFVSSTLPCLFRLLHLDRALTRMDNPILFSLESAKAELDLAEMFEG